MCATIDDNFARVHMLKRTRAVWYTYACFLRKHIIRIPFCTSERVRARPPLTYVCCAAPAGILDSRASRRARRARLCYTLRTRSLDEHAAHTYIHRQRTYPHCARLVGLAIPVALSVVLVLSRIGGLPAFGGRNLDSSWDNPRTGHSRAHNAGWGKGGICCWDGRVCYRCRGEGGGRGGISIGDGDGLEIAEIGSETRRLGLGRGQRCRVGKQRDGRVLDDGHVGVLVVRSEDRCRKLNSMMRAAMAKSREDLIVGLGSHRCSMPL